MACNCPRPKVSRLEFLRRFGKVLRGLDWQGAQVLSLNIAEAFVRCGAPCRAALIEGAETFKKNWMGAYVRTS